MSGFMTDEDRIDRSRAAFELQQQFGQDAHKFAAKRAADDSASGDAEQVQFWKWVEAALRPRSRN